MHGLESDEWFLGQQWLGLKMFRKALIDMLLGNPMTVSQIAQLVDESPGRIADDLNHLFRSLKHCGTGPLSRLRVSVFRGEINQAIQMPGMQKHLGPGTKARD